ncbi:MAG: cupin domain-containing protein [Coprobacter sp.]|nr:cupin domain-containing protein [Coprobacter sp.]
MATIIKRSECDFQPNPNKIDGFRLLTDMSRSAKGINPKYLNFDIRQLNPKQYNAAYHFHRYAEELFVILSGTSTLRTPKGLEVVEAGDLIFFESGEQGAHQLYNHSDAPCVFLDMRSYIGHDVCEYPDSDKIIIVPNGETFKRSEQRAYFEGETNIDSIWENLRNKFHQ